MSDYIPKDPYNPNDPKNFDRYGNAKFEPAVDDTGKGPYILLGLLVAIGMIGGLLYFNGAPKEGADVAQAPARPAIERTVPTLTPTPATPATPATPTPATTPANPAPAAPAGGTQ
jgi:hypothetical protein